MFRLLSVLAPPLLSGPAKTSRSFISGAIVFVLAISGIFLVVFGSFSFLELIISTELALLALGGVLLLTSGLIYYLVNRKTLSASPKTEDNHDLMLKLLPEDLSNSQALKAAIKIIEDQPLSSLALALIAGILVTKKL